MCCRVESARRSISDLAANSAFHSSNSFCIEPCSDTCSRSLMWRCSVSNATGVACCAASRRVKQASHPVWLAQHLTQMPSSPHSASARTTWPEKHSSHEKCRSSAPHSIPPSRGSGQWHTTHVRTLRSSPNLSATAAATRRSAGSGASIELMSAASSVSLVRRPSSPRSRLRASTLHPPGASVWRKRSWSPSQIMTSRRVTPSAKTSDAVEGVDSGAR
mmetsp:Transcript_19106/g.54267  ORF Transcript_19106/g.54267 Transcript_19106/m.54267 type:complete len:218 (-) Transcript_19106:295-948(-)